MARAVFLSDKVVLLMDKAFFLMARAVFLTARELSTVDVFLTDVILTDGFC